MIDSHCNLSQADYDMPVADLIKVAEKGGVHKMLNIACDTGDWDELLQLINTYKDVYGAIGIHPEYALRNEDDFLKKGNYCQNSKKTSERAAYLTKRGLFYCRSHSVTTLFPKYPKASHSCECLKQYRFSPLLYGQPLE